MKQYEYLGMVKFANTKAKERELKALGFREVEEVKKPNAAASNVKDDANSDQQKKDKPAKKDKQAKKKNSTKADTQGKKEDAKKSDVPNTNAGDLEQRIDEGTVDGNTSTKDIK